MSTVKKTNEDLVYLKGGWPAGVLHIMKWASHGSHLKFKCLQHQEWLRISVLSLRLALADSMLSVINYTN